MKAVLLFLETWHPIEFSSREIEALEAKLPQGYRKVLHAEKTIGVLIPPYNILAIVASRLQPALSKFKSYRFFGLSGETYCSDRGFDPIEDWMDGFRTPTYRRLRQPTRAVVRLPGARE